MWWISWAASRHHRGRHLGHNLLIPGSSRLDADVVEEGGVIAPGAVAATESDDVSPRRDLERPGRVEAVGRVGRPDGGHDDVVDQDVEVVVAAQLEVDPLGRLEAQPIATVLPSVDGL